MKVAGKFEKVSFEEFKKSFEEKFGTDKNIKEIYDKIKLPKRATVGSAGYDFFSPISFTLKPNESIDIPTGIRCYMTPGWVLKCYPRSSLGYKYRIQMDDSVPIIDQDYYYSDNEGHIFLKITNDTKDNKDCEVLEGTGFAQGIFVEFGITLDDMVSDIRNGGFGSTTKHMKEEK